MEQGKGKATQAATIIGFLSVMTARPVYQTKTLQTSGIRHTGWAPPIVVSFTQAVPRWWARDVCLEIPRKQ